MISLTVRQVADALHVHTATVYKAVADGTIPHVRVSNTIRIYDTLGAAEVAVLLAAVPDEWRDLFATAIYTAMRKGELFGLRKADVSLEDGTITVKRSYNCTTPKGGRKGTLPHLLTDDLRHSLNTLPAAPPRHAGDMQTAEEPETEGPGSEEIPSRTRPLDWRAIQDSNLWPSAPEADALSN